MKLPNQPFDTETAALIKSLKEHQLELELQNEELRIAKQRSDEATQKYHDLYDFAPTGYLTLTAEGVIIELNLSASTILGRDRSSLVNDYFINFIADDSKECFTNFLTDVCTSRVNQTIEIQIVTGHDSLLSAQLSGIVKESQNYCMLTLFDITRLKLAEDLLIKKEAEYRKSIFNYSEPIFSFNRDETYRFVNESFARLFGLIPEEMVGKSIHNFLSINEGQRRLEFIRNIFSSGVKGELEVKIIGPSGEERFFATTADPFFNEHGDILYVNCFSKEITQLKTISKALMESKEQLSALLSAIPDLILVQNEQGVFLDFHGSVLDDLYSSLELFLGKKMSDILPVEVSAQFYEAIKATKRTNEVQHCEYSLVINNELKYFEAKIVAMTNGQFLSLIRNVSSFKLSESIAREKNEQLEKINGEKDKFFSIIAHDLRGPFSGFLGLTEALVKRLPDMTLLEIQEITLLMRNSAVALFRLLGNLLEWSKLQRGLTVFDPRFFQLYNCVTEYFELANQLSSQKGIQINYDVSINIEVYADEKMVETIIRNLLSNALKFTARGGEINVSATKYQDNWIEISVSDTGIGLSELLLSQLFKIDSHSSRKGTEGEVSSGLGLLICKDFITKHGGEFKVVSTQGVGSTFSFTLPTQKIV